MPRRADSLIKNFYKQQHLANLLEWKEAQISTTSNYDRPSLG